MHVLDRELDAQSIAMSPLCLDTAEVKPEWWSEDRSGWQDTYTARRRVFEDGQAVVTVCKDRHFVGPAMSRNRAKRGESENREANDDDAGRRAKKTVRDACQAIGADRMVTLTYRENMVDREKALSDWKKFCRKLGKHKSFHYVAVLEHQARGALHFHVACQGRQVYALLRSIWQGIVGLGPSGEQMGQVNVRNCYQIGGGRNGVHKLANYIAKYCTKQMECRDLNEKRYFRSRGIVVPEPALCRLRCYSMLGAVQSAFAMLEGFNLEGLQSWVNNGLGVVWLSTAPLEVSTVEDCPF